MQQSGGVASVLPPSPPETSGRWPRDGAAEGEPGGRASASLPSWGNQFHQVWVVSPGDGRKQGRPGGEHEASGRAGGQAHPGSRGSRSSSPPPALSANSLPAPGCLRLALLSCSGCFKDPSPSGAAARRLAEPARSLWLLGSGFLRVAAVAPLVSASVLGVKGSSAAGCFILRERRSRNRAPGRKGSPEGVG